MIPRIIHQTWKTNEIPERWRSWQQSWRDRHPDYAYRYWTDADNREFMALHYPDYLDVYDGHKLGVHRADMVRYFILRHFGGIYADMDFEALKPLDPLLEGKSLVFGLEPDSHAVRAPVIQRGLTRIVCNALIASLLPSLARSRHLTTPASSSACIASLAEMLASRAAFRPVRASARAAATRDARCSTMRAMPDVTVPAGSVGDGLPGDGVLDAELDPAGPTAAFSAARCAW